MELAKGNETEEGFAFTVLGIRNTDGCQPWTKSAGGYVGYFSFKEDQDFLLERLPALDLESVCNRTLLVQDGSQITAFGQETIGGQIGIIHPEVMYNYTFHLVRLRVQTQCVLHELPALHRHLPHRHGAQGLQEPEVPAQRLPLVHLELRRDHRHRDHGGRRPLLRRRDSQVERA